MTRQLFVLDATTPLVKMHEPEPGALQTDRLSLALSLRATTKAALGDTVGVTRQFIHQLENGTRTPTTELLNAIACALNVAPKFLLNHSPERVGRGYVHFRRLRASTKREQERARAQGILLELVVNCLEAMVELPRPNFPRLTARDSRGVEEAADECRRHWGLTPYGPITSVTRVIERAGGVVGLFKNDDDRIDAFSWKGAGHPIVMRSATRGTPTRIRFSLAHELGHLVLHSAGVSVGQDEELQANSFASAFLMPRTAFMSAFPKSKRLDWVGMFAMKRRWGTSLQAIVRRAHDLGLLDAVQYRRANVHVRAKGWTKSEPREPPEPEEPETLRMALAYAGSTPPEAFRRVASAVGVTPDDIASLIGQRAGRVVSLARGMDV